MPTINHAKGDIIYGEIVTVNKQVGPGQGVRQDKAREEQCTDKATEQQSKVFIIHGQNEAKWRELDSILRSMGLCTVVLQEQTDDGKTIIEKFEHYAAQCRFAMALFTYDDIVIKNSARYLQVRPNVIFELGWFYARLGREHVMILEQKTEGGNVFSDLQGILRTQYRENVEEAHKRMQDQLKKAGILA